MKTQHFTLTLLLLLVGWGSVAQTNETHSFTNLNRSVPDGNYAGLSDAHSVSSTVANVTALRVKLKVAGEFNGDLYGYLRHVGAGTTNFCVLVNRVGRTASNPNGYDDAGIDMTLDDAAVNGNIHNYRTVTNLPSGTPLVGIWHPDGRKVNPATVLDSSAVTTTLGSFTGTDASGEWTLFLADLESGGTNLLVGWELQISGQTRPPVTWPNPADIVYGTALGSTQLNASSPVAGSFVYNPPLNTVLSAGNGQSLSVTFTPGDAVNYVPFSTNVFINTLKKPLSITAVSTNKVYGAALPTFAASYSGFISGDAPANLTTPVSFSTTAGVGSNAGIYPITPSGATSTNYLISFFDGQLTVTKAGTAGLVNSSKNPTLPGESVTFTLAVSAVAPGSGTPTGNVQFKVDGATAGSPVALSGATAGFGTTTLPAGTHLVLAEYAGDNNFVGTTNQLSVNQLVNTPPVAATDTIERPSTNGTKVLISVLLSNDSDADGNSISFVAVSATSTNGGLITRDANWVYYTPATGATNDDAFTYTVSDTYGAVATGTVLIKIKDDTLPSPNLRIIDQGNGSYLIKFDGVPGKSCRIEFKATLNQPNWDPLGSATADQFGTFQYLDTPPLSAPVRFYRSIYP